MQYDTFKDTHHSFIQKICLNAHCVQGTGPRCYRYEAEEGTILPFKSLQTGRDTVHRGLEVIPNVKRSEYSLH